MRLRYLSAVLAVALTSLLAPSRATASCAEFPPLEEHLARAGVVFTGTVMAVADEKRTATVAVEEIWRGPALPAEVVVHGGFDAEAFTSVDRSFDEGTRYLFAPAISEGRLQDDSCTATRPWTDELAGLRPTTVATPQPAADGRDDAGEGLPTPIVLGGALIALVGTISILAFRSRRS